MLSLRPTFGHLTILQWGCIYITYDYFTMNNLLKDLKDATLESETTPDVSGYTEVTATSGSCEARPDPSKVSLTGKSPGISHVGARIISARQIEAWRDPGYYIS